MELTYHSPTRIIAGEDCIRKYAVELKAFGSKALIVTGASSAKKNGSQADIMTALGMNAQKYAIYDRVPPNPTVASVYDGAALAKAEGCDFVIAVGGGSPMDAAKVIALLAVNDLPVQNLFTGPYGGNILPLVCVPTTAGTGSEVTQYAIVTNDGAETKSGIGTPLFFPRLSFLDPRYLESLPRNTMINTVIDSLSHSIEGIISTRATLMTDTLAVRGIALISECLSQLAEGNLSRLQLERLLLASSLGGMVIANTGTTILHAMGYSLTYFHGIDHGRANGLLLASALEHVGLTRPDLVRRILEPLRVNSLHTLRIKLDTLLGEREMIPQEDFQKFADKALASKNAANCAVLPDRSAVISMYESSLSVTPSPQTGSSLRRANIPFVVLEKYLPGEFLRVIPARLRNVPPGHTEIPVEFELSPGFDPGARIPVSWDGTLHGFVHDSDQLRSVFSGVMADGYARRRVFLNDWGDVFLLTFENGTRDREIEYFVTPTEVRALFRSCRIQGEPSDLR